MAEPQIQYEINELDKFALFTPSGGNQRARLSWAVRRSNPRISVFPNTPDDTSKSPITAAFDPEHFLMFLAEFEEIIKGPNDQKRKVDCYTRFRDKETGKPGELTLSSEVWFGKDDNGICWISLISGNRSKIKFEIRLSEYHKFYKGDGSQLTESEGSIRRTLSILNTLRHVYMTFAGTFREKNPAAVGNGNTKTSATNLPSDETFGDIPF